jgi:DNA-directed RNA polymerase subunit RPC12/RpoP
MYTPRHCPGYEAYKKLDSFRCKCANCAAEKEIFSDEFDKQHNCSNCGERIDFTRCEHYAGARRTDPR